MKEFNKTLEIIEKLRENCPVDKKRTSTEVLFCIVKELKELDDEIKMQSKENIIEELGDLLFNVLFLIDIEKKRYNFKTERVFEKVNNKMIFRHPYIFKEPKKVTLEKAEKIWKEQKIKEQELKIIH